MGNFTFFLAAVFFISPATSAVYGQGRGGRGGGDGSTPQQPQTARAMAVFDMTGYWISMVTEDWRFRMITPLKGDFNSSRGGGFAGGIPLNPEGRKVANSWDPAKDEAAGEQCKSYGAANIMRVPERLHITWQDDQSLKIETDTGSQTRTFYFGEPRGQGGDWQGVSKATWDLGPDFGVKPTNFDPRFGSQSRIPGGSLKVVTTKLRPGYLLKNGVPYSANAVVTEYYDRVTTRNGDVYLVVTTTVDDPTYLTQPYLTSTSFRKQGDSSGWNPTPCTAK
jgi:hypothetical protein